jgi:uncharacterized membrane protein YedE/YeeE
MTEAKAAPPIQSRIALFAVAALLALAALAGRADEARGAGAALIGGAAGVALYHAAFGFTAAWRRFARERRGVGLRAQMLLIGLSCLATFPLIAHTDAQGVILPMGLASALGAALFGVGMQLGGGCASGTLFTVGGGSVRMAATLIFFVVGSVWATAHFDVWGAWPLLNDRRGVSLIAALGLPGALAATLLAAGAVAVASAWIERRAHGALEPSRSTASLLRGPWSPTAGAVALAAVGVATLFWTGRPWGVTWGFALWGGLGAETLGIDVRSWPYWSGWRALALDRGVFGVAASVMDLGIVAGAMTAAALAGRWAPSTRLSPRELATAAVGGLMMGWGARMAYGCNIGAYLGGVVSGSLHGWWWLVFGYAGSLAGVRLRVALGVDPPVRRAPI